MPRLLLFVGMLLGFVMPVYLGTSARTPAERPRSGLTTNTVALPVPTTAPADTGENGPGMDPNG